MNGLKYNSILYFISLVILATLCIQVYWNYKNYQTGKQQMLNDVQTSLDNAVDGYYTLLAKRSPFRTQNDSTIRGERRTQETFKLRDGTLTHTMRGDSMHKGVTIVKSQIGDSIDLNIRFIDTAQITQVDSSIFEFIDATKNPITELSSKIVVSFREDELSLPKIDSLFAEELQRKNIRVDYGLKQTNSFQKTEELRPEIIEKATLETVSKSPYFLYNNQLTAHFSNVTLAVLKRNLLGIFLSFVLVGSVIFCLLYLLKIIRQQKQLAEIKNDLINNITHEFKTPIATIGIAMEAIQNFNSENDTEKNLRYAKLSGEQVGKLNLMVEKLLETATLDSEKLELNFESHNLVDLLRKATHKEVFSEGEKKISLVSSEEEISYPIDVFHFENAVNNIIDNAIKYGGKDISVAIQKNKNTVEISIRDSGSSLTEAQKKQIFEKFYRVPKGNTHDVKGFGIGLYYSKKIVEKHGGTITVSIQAHTVFKITLPHG
jgi:two-component system phosphate regulon sensor histidine kinase PhoR